MPDGNARVHIARSAAKTIRKLGARDQKWAVKKIEKLAVDPRPRGAEKLKSNPEYLRVRSGDIRIIYRVLDEQELVVVLVVRDRKDVYKDLEKLDARLAHALDEMLGEVDVKPAKRKSSKGEPKK